MVMEAPGLSIAALSCVLDHSEILLSLVEGRRGPDHPLLEETYTSITKVATCCIHIINAIEYF